MKRDLIRKYFLEANPKEDRTDCPDEATLKAVAENRVDPNHPARLHLESCSPCFAEFRGFKLDADDRRRQRTRRLYVAVGAVAACILLAVFLMRFTRKQAQVQVARIGPPPAVSTSQPEVARDLDLSQYLTTRGANSDEAFPLKQVSLPAAVVHLRILLPRLSRPGEYHVAVSIDRSGNNVVADGNGMATGADPHTMLAVTLDLRRAAPGSYFLSTESEQDGGAYYYPLKLE